MSVGLPLSVENWHTTGPVEPEPARETTDGGEDIERRVVGVRLLGHGDRAFEQTEEALSITLPALTPVAGPHGFNCVCRISMRLCL